MIIIMFVFGFAALMISMYLGVGFIAGLVMLFLTLWKIVCLPCALLRAIFRLGKRVFSKKAKAI